MTFDKELNKKGLGELYYGKENLMGDKKIPAGDDLGHGYVVEKGSMVLSTIKDEKVGEVANRILDEDSKLDRNSARDCKKAINRAKRELNKKTRYHVDLSESMGKDFAELAEKMGLTLNAVVKLFLMENWMKYNAVGFDYIYLGVADRPKAPGEIPY